MTSEVELAFAPSPDVEPPIGAPFRVLEARLLKLDRREFIVLAPEAVLLFACSLSNSTLLVCVGAVTGAILRDGDEAPLTTVEPGLFKLLRNGLIIFRVSTSTKAGC